MAFRGSSFLQNRARPRESMPAEISIRFCYYAGDDDPEIPSRQHSQQIYSNRSHALLIYVQPSDTIRSQHTSRVLLAASPFCCLAASLLNTLMQILCPRYPCLLNLVSHLTNAPQIYLYPH